MFPCIKTVSVSATYDGKPRPIFLVAGAIHDILFVLASILSSPQSNLFYQVGNPIIVTNILT